MNKRLSLLLFLALAAPSSAATTWTTDKTTFAPSGAVVAKAVCTTGSEAAPAAGDGIALEWMAGCVVYAEAAAAMTAGAKLVAYAWNPVTSRWNPAPDLDLVVAALQYQTFPGLIVAADVARYAWVPSGVGQAVTLYVICTPHRK